MDMATQPHAYSLLDGTPRHLDPKYRLELLVGWTVFVVVLVATGLFVAIRFDAPVAVAAVIGVGLALQGLVIVSVHLRWRRFIWQATDEALALSHGVIVRRSSFVPYHRIQQIDLRQSPVQRLLGLSTLILCSAAATTDAEIPGVLSTDADSLRQEFLHRAGLDDAV